ncbi:hypothetical protein N8645_01230 [bacterium]|nr:hypothetical protein [bacterium]
MQMLALLVTTLIAFGEPEQWTSCLYNNESIGCRRTFKCPKAPCGTFKIEWKDGISDIFTWVRDGVSRNVRFYEDTRGGEWTLIEFAGSFALVNQNNKNTIIFDMTLRECRKSGLRDHCK